MTRHNLSSATQLNSLEAIQAYLALFPASIASHRTFQGVRGNRHGPDDQVDEVGERGECLDLYQDHD